MNKKTILFCILGALLIASTEPNDQKDFSLARAPQLDGKYIFLYTVPYHDHDTLFKMSTVVLSNNPDKAIPAVLKKANKEAAERGVTFDGIITGRAQFDYIIKFKE